MSEDSRGVYGGARHNPSGRGHLRHPVPAANGAYKFGAPDSISGNHANTGSAGVAAPKSWQARNQWYSRTVIYVSIGAVIAIALMGLVR